MPMWCERSVAFSDRGEPLKANHLEILKRSARETHVRVELIEGKNRELRRLFSTFGHEITRLKRVAVGGLALGNLAPGNWRQVSSAELRRAFSGAPLRPEPEPQRCP